MVCVSHILQDNFRKSENQTTLVEFAARNIAVRLTLLN